MNNLQELFGNIDVYLFDQILKGRIQPDMKILDAGCGGGRNLYYFLQQGMDVYGVDQNAEAIDYVRHLAREKGKNDAEKRFRVEGVERLSFEPQTFDWVICNAVLHFAKDPAHFEAMLNAMWSVLKPGGCFIARLASDIGIEPLVRPIANSWYFLPDGSERFLVNQDMLLHYTQKLGGALLDPIKTTNVQNLRCMTTWCMVKQ